MVKSTKIILAIIAATLLVCILIVGVSIGVKKNKNDNITTTVSSITEETSNSVESTVTSVTESTTESTTAAPTLSEQLIGSWMDSANMSGFEFFKDGRVTVTYVNLTIPFLDLPINGTASGTYVVDGTNVTMKYSIYSATIKKSYTASVVGNELSLVNTEDNKTSTYQKIENTLSDVPTTYVVPDYNADLQGAWVNADSSIKYSFDNESKVMVTYNNATDSSVSNSKLNGTYSGIYISQDNTLIIQFIMNNKKVTQNLTYSISKNTMNLTDSSGNTNLFVREGTSSVPTVSPESLNGKWKDSMGSGYMFNDGGIVEITYVDFTVPVVNMPITGTYKGTYSVSGNELTLRYSIAGKSVSSVYLFAIEGNTLTLTDKDSGKISSFIKEG